jgi:esterase/lipase superfamily enzyme
MSTAVLARLVPAPQPIEVTGYVHDEYGLPVAGAVVELVDEFSGNATEVFAETSGEFHIRFRTHATAIGRIALQIQASIDGYKSKKQDLVVQVQGGPVEKVFAGLRIVKNFGWHRKDSPRPPEATKVVKVFFATDRTLEEDQDSFTYGVDRQENEMNYGTCEVHVPLDERKPGNMEGCLSMPFRNSDLANFEKDLETAAKEGNLDTGFLFVHGFNVTFKEAVRRTAQIACDMKFAGIPILFSWPSKGEADCYDLDVHAVANSRRNLRLLMKRLLISSPLKTIHVIAHSLGCRLTLISLELLHETLKHQPQLLKYIVFGAPDVEIHDFIGSVSEIGEICERITTYVSEKDTALHLARKIYHYTRAGDCAGGNYVAVKCMDTIDATEASIESPFGHSYLFDGSAVLGDLHEIIVQWLKVPRFRLNAYKKTPAGTVWKLKS